MSRAHGVAFAYDAGHGFATSGADSSVTMFDLKTLKVLGTTIAAASAPASAPPSCQRRDPASRLASARARLLPGIRTTAAP